MAPIITLLTDFGYDDGYVAAMKGVILGLAPDAILVDITHAIAPQAVAQAAYVLAQAAPFFPPGVIHLAVVDPGVGGARRPLAIETAQARYVGPDNGLFSAILAQNETAHCVHLDQPRFWREAPSSTFHGRDIFAPAAAHLARGVPLAALGAPIDDAQRLALATPQRRADGAIEGAIIHVDHFGNLISNIPLAWLAGEHWQVRIGQARLAGIQPTFAAAPEGALLAYGGSAGALEIAIRNGSAAHRLALGAGAPILVERAHAASSLDD